MGTYLEIAELGELLPALVQKTGKRFDVFVGDLVRAHIASLGEPLWTDVAGERLFPCMATLMGLMASDTVYTSLDAQTPTLRLPSCEKRCPHDGSLQT